ncbi:MAG: hypothetical protein N2Z23_10590 [Pyrinomonadaceae bacterium]|nr:hypothetical protein [Pyrinomonadaceae bacterium]MCX7640872.1 hypothetical protein [Pyrinomonadaceae bacterium]MDW8304284.1 hypothetical protein [Acidobacteriota bacterium]
MENFYNDGFGWVCKHCERELKTDNSQLRLMTEGEAESKNPPLSNPALAKWLDAARTILTCPRCGITEPLEKV